MKPITVLRMWSVGCAAGLALSIAAVFAKAPFDHADPGPEQVVATMPAQIDLYTASPTSPAPADTQAVVSGPDGRQADMNQSTVDPANHMHIIVPMKADLPPGRYIVSFKTAGEYDREADGGSYAFYVGRQPTAADLRADKVLTQTVPPDFTLTVPGFTGFTRGLVEGGIPLLILVPAGLYYW